MAAKKKPVAKAAAKKPEAKKPEAKKPSTKPAKKEEDKKPKEAEAQEEKKEEAVEEVAENKVEKELREAAGLEGKGKGKDGKKAVPEDETHAAYAARLCGVVSELSDEVYEKFSSEAQGWFEVACAVMNGDKKGEIPDFPSEGKPEKKKKAKEKEEKKEEAQEDKGKDEEKEEPKKGKKSTDESSPRKRSGGSDKARDVYADEPTQSQEDFLGACKKAGIDVAESQLTKMYKEGKNWFDKFKSAGHIKK